MSPRLLDSFLLGRTTGEVVAFEREQVVSDLILAGFKYAPLAVRKSRSFAEFYELRSDLLSCNAHGTPGSVAVRVTNRIIEEERHGH